MYFKDIFRSRYFRLKYGLLALILVVVLFLGLNFPAIAAKATTSNEQNRAIALRFAEDGWGTNPNWEKVWDQLVSPNLNSSTS